METPNVSSAADQYDSAIDPGNHGKIFEKDLAFATFVSASLAECRFKLAAEMKAAEKFDDVVLFNEESKDVWLFQAKHSKEGGQITFDDLFSTDPKENNFAFCKYLQSYLNIREKPVFAKYEPRVFMFTNNSLDETEELTKLLNIQTQTVNSMIRWCDPEKYVCFEPRNDEAVSNITKIMNVPLESIKKDIEELSETGKDSNLLVYYLEPLKNIMHFSDGSLSFKDPDKDSLDFATHQWLLKEFKVKPQESLNKKKLDKTILTKIKKFFARHSRNKLISVPRMVTEKDTREFFKSLIFCVKQPTDLRSVAEDLISDWMHRWVGSKNLGQFGKDQTKLFQSKFHDVFDQWHKNTNKPKDFLKFETDGSKCIRSIKTEIKKRLLKKNSSNSITTPMYVRRTLIITKIKDEDDETDSQDRETRQGRYDLQTKHVSDNEFMKQLNTITVENKCQVLIAEPGMGKTTLIAHLYSQLEDSQNVDVYLIRLKNLKFSQERKSDLLHIFQHELSQESRNILLRDLQNEENRILFLLDGFDEMDSSYHISFVEAIENIMKKQNTQCIITGRNHVHKLLEVKFNVIALKLKPFDHNEQVNFLELFWKVDRRDELFKDFSTQLLDKFHSEINDNDYDFTGLPLMIRMLAEVYGDEFLKFLNTRVLNFSEKLNVLTLFENFVKISFNIKMRKLEENTSNAYDKADPKFDKVFEPCYDVIIKKHQVLAIQYLAIQDLSDVLNELPKYVGNLSDIQAQVHKGEEKSLLLSASTTNQVDFIHLSYAEYFVASFLFDHLNNYKSSLLGIIKQREVVRKFFLLMVEIKCNYESNQIEALESLYGQDSALVVWACLGGNEKIATKLLRSSGVRDADPNHQILLHAAAAGGSISLVAVLLGEFEFYVNLQLEKTLYDFLSDGDFAIHVATRKNNLNIVKLLIANKALVNAVNSSFSTPLYIAAEKNYLKLVEFLIQMNANVNSETKYESTPLRIAAENGHLEVAKLLIHNGADVNYATNDGWTSLHSAAENGHLAVVKFLIVSNIDVNCTKKDGWTPIHSAAQNGHLDVVTFLFGRDAYVNAVTNDGMTPLHSAAENGHLEVVKLLINRDVNVESTRKDGWKPLHLAAENGHPEVIEFLIDRKANVNSTTNDEWTPLHVAAENGHLAVVKLLIKKRANVNSATYYGLTPLHSAAENGQLWVVNLLIRSHANVNSVTNQKLTPLHSAAENGQLKVVKLLIESGANINSATNDGLTPLHSAAEKGHLWVVKLLIENHANINSATNDGMTPLHLAAKDGHLWVVKWLIEKMANVNSVTNHKLTPLHSAAENGQLKVVKLLIESGANINSATNDGLTPLHSAEKKGHLEVVKLLIETGVNVNSATNDGMTPLHSSAKDGHLEIVKLLNESHVNVESTTNNGLTPHHSAQRAGTAGIWRVLLLFLTSFWYFAFWYPLYG